MENSDSLFGGQEDGAMALLKAMVAGQITGRDTTGQTLTMEPLKAESLDTTLKKLEFRQQDIKLMNKMPKLTAYNTVEEFLQLKSFGDDKGGFYGEGELSDVEDSQYVRRSELIKYVQVTGEVTMQAQLVRSFADAMRQEVENKAMWIARRTNTALTKANSSVVPQEWNSLYTQHASIGTGEQYLYSSLENYYTNKLVVDMRGRSVKQIDIEKAAVVIDGNFGNVTDFFAPTAVISTISQDYFNSQRLMFGNKTTGSYEGQIGTVIKNIATSIGDVDLNADKFMARSGDKDVKTTASVAIGVKAPAAPTAGTVPALVSDTTSKYQTAEGGLVYYAVSALNRYGESVLTVLDATAITLALNYAVDLTFTASSGANAATGFRIYRTLVTVSATPTGINFYPIFDISTAELAAGYDGAAATKVRDRGRILPNTEQGFLTEMNEQILSYKRLAPVSKLDLAITTMSRRFITFEFATPQLYQGQKLIRFINCSKTLTS